MFLAQVLPRHTLQAWALYSLLKQLLSGSTIKAATDKLRLPFAMETIYHLVARARERLDVLRSRLCGRQPAPESSHSDPLLQTVEHLRSVFAQAVCPVEEFQVVFQQPLMG